MLTKNLDNAIILEERNVIDDHLLDLIGNDFKFDHEKGLSEWLKNSVDAYIRNNVPDKDQYIFFRLADGKQDDSILECVDFVGMDEIDIEKAFKVWGNPDAAKRGTNKRTYGGHGNGGKFYMRQMFKKSYFITYKNGLLSIFGFNERKKYGFVDGFKNKKIPLADALKIASIDEIYSLIKDKLNSQTNAGFTTVRGICPSSMPNKIKAERIIEKIKNHPQARNIIKRINLGVVYNGKIVTQKLKSDELKPMIGFENPSIIPVPDVIELREDGEIQKIVLSNSKYPAGNLILYVSDMAFERNGRHEGLNRIDIIGEIGVIASYRLYELGVKNFPQAAFIYGECSCPILEDLDSDAIKNDRTVLVSENPRVKVLLPWISQQIDMLAGKISAKEQAEREKNSIKISSIYNDFLNQWKNKFMRKILSETITKNTDGLNIGDDEFNGDGVFNKKNLDPVADIQFSASEAKIPLNEKCRITLKTNTPKAVPFGSVINFSSSNEFIKMENDSITIVSSYTKETDGETVAVVNLEVVGTKVGEKGLIAAVVGPYKATINLEVIESKQSKLSRKPNYPKVLLSGIDTDPLNISQDGQVMLSERQPLIHQRIQDVKEGIYWINTAAPLAQAILKKYGSESIKWRDYLLQRYVDIFMKEAIYELQRKDPDLFSAENIDGYIFGELIPKIYINVASELNDFLFRENYDLPAR
ncbi:MAG: hypothetical protein PHT24_06330 [Endomicrobiaceae bacterium]|nr:hypothetical protein [Endomicrobiaceae bacterium]